MNAITLTWHEVCMATNVATMRNIAALQRGWQHAYNMDPANGWNAHIEGACAELAIAKYLNRYWCGKIGLITPGDVGKIEVRSTRWDDGCLILHPKDSDSSVFVLITGTIPEFTPRGWIYGSAGKRDEYWRDPTSQNRPAYFVPQAALEPMSELPCPQ